MDANINNREKPAVLGNSYKKQTTKVPEESLLDENYFMNSEVLTGIPGIASEDEQDYLLTASTSSTLHSLQSMEKERTTTEHKTEGEREIHTSNLRLTDFLPQLSKESMLQTIRKDLSLSRQRAVQESYTSKESGRAGIFQDTFSRESDCKLKRSFDTKQGKWHYIHKDLSISQIRKAVVERLH